MANTSAGGWHPDPTGRHQHRWWDGTQWTDQVADGGVTATDPMTPPPPGPALGQPPTAPGPSRSGTNWRLLGILGAVVVAAVAVAIVLVVVLGDDGTSRDEQVDVCVAAGSSRSQGECTIDEYLDNGGSLDELDADQDDYEDPEDLPPGLIEAAFSCLDR